MADQDGSRSSIDPFDDPTMHEGVDLTAAR